MRYTIKHKDAMGDVLVTIDTPTLQHAAQRFADRLQCNAVARRVTGLAGLSGVFQAYKPIGDASTSVGHPFHVAAE